MPEPMIARHWHWSFVAFNLADASEDFRTIHWGVTVDVIGYESEADAVIAAGMIVNRERFLLRSVRECNTCGFQNKVADNLRDFTSKL